MKTQILDNQYWIVKREIIKNNYDFNEQWVEIIERFKTRIENFYFKPIDKVKHSNELKGEGFTILTIQCALIEMFASFKLGKIHKYNKRPTDPNFYYRNSEECFIPFLHSEKIFENHFYKIEIDEKKIDQPFSAGEFYNKVRCGLMHEARTKGEWIINAKKEYNGDESIYISVDSTRNKIIIDKTILKKKKKKYFQNYISELKQDNENGNNLRRLFARKIDHLYDLESDLDFEWWNEN